MLVVSMPKIVSVLFRMIVAVDQQRHILTGLALLSTARAASQVCFSRLEVRLRVLAVIDH